MNIWAVILLVIAAFCGGFLLGHGTGIPRCVICAKPLPRVCPGGQCGGTPGRSETEQLIWGSGGSNPHVHVRTHGIYSTAVGDGAAVIMCECGWTVEMDTLAQARSEHTVHVAQIGGAA